ncbi:MAG: hypothetical protein R3C68_16885 [Myxococcota bacterium]
MSTGPHLHYGLKRWGSYVNPSAQKFERRQALSSIALERFRENVANLVERLDRIRLAQHAKDEPIPSKG